MLLRLSSIMSVPPSRVSRHPPLLVLFAVPRPDKRCYNAKRPRPERAEARLCCTETTSSRSVETRCWRFFLAIDTEQAEDGGIALIRSEAVFLLHLTGWDVPCQVPEPRCRSAKAAHSLRSSDHRCLSDSELLKLTRMLSSLCCCRSRIVQAGGLYASSSRV